MLNGQWERPWRSREKVLFKSRIGSAHGTFSRINSFWPSLATTRWPRSLLAPTGNIKAPKKGSPCIEGPRLLRYPTARRRSNKMVEQALLAQETSCWSTQLPQVAHTAQLLRCLTFNTWRHTAHSILHSWCGAHYGQSRKLCSIEFRGKTRAAGFLCYNGTVDGISYNSNGHGKNAWQSARPELLVGQAWFGLCEMESGLIPATRLERRLCWKAIQGPLTARRTKSRKEQRRA